MSALEFAAEHRTSVGATGTFIIIAGVLAFILLHSARQAPPPPPPHVTMVVIQPPKPPPPPPLPQPKTIVQPKMTAPEQKPLIPNQPPKPAPPKPAAPAATPMGTSIHNNGPADAFNLNGNPGGNGFLNGGAGGGGSRWGYYAAEVQSQIQSALQKNKITRNASAGLQVRIWADAGGAVTRVELDKSSSDPRVDDAIKNQVLLHLRFNQPPPSDMPMPIVMSLTGEQPL